jgi:hypothetical protein
MSSAERGFHKALSTLRQIQKDRGFVPPKDEAAPLSKPKNQSEQRGFVPQNQHNEQNRDCQGALPEPECPPDIDPECPPDIDPECPPDIDPMDWSCFWASVNQVRNPSRT